MKVAWTGPKLRAHPNESDAFGLSTVKKFPICPRSVALFARLQFQPSDEQRRRQGSYAADRVACLVMRCWWRYRTNGQLIRWSARRSHAFRASKRLSFAPVGRRTGGTWITGAQVGPFPWESRRCWNELCRRFALRLPYRRGGAGKLQRCNPSICLSARSYLSLNLRMTIGERICLQRSSDLCELFPGNSFLLSTLFACHSG